MNTSFCKFSKQSNTKFLQIGA